MNRVGFVISHKNNEKRRALLPKDLNKVRQLGSIFFEKGYGESLGISDDEYTALGATVVTRKEAHDCDTIGDVKLGDADYLPELNGPRTLVGWAHTVQNVDFTSAVLDAGHTVIAWEEIYDKGRYIFYRNREIAGEAAVLQGFRFSGKMPYDAKIAIIGNGQTGKGAYMILSGLGGGVNTDVYARKDEERFRKNLGNYDVIINCVMWDTHRTDRLIYREDLKRMRPGTLIIDVSCDPHLEIETSHPTTIDNPVYEVDGILHYAVDNTPAMYPYTVSKILSKGFVPYVDTLVTGEYPGNLIKAMVIEKGHILDKNIIDFRTARGLFCK